MLMENTMKRMLILLSLVLTASCASAAHGSAAKKFLTFSYGGDDTSINEICQPNDDLWMLRGTRNPEAIQAVESAPINLKDPGIYTGIVGRDLCVVEMRQGKIDPSFNLSMVYSLHRNLILHFLYASLIQDRQQIAGLVTKPDNVSFGKAKAVPQGDMDVYLGVLGMLPIVRASTPAADKASKSITYRLPLDEHGFELRLQKQGNTWKIDTEKKIKVPLGFFFQRGEKR